MRPHLCDAFLIFYGMDKTSMSNLMKNRLNKKGFTLAEVLVTVAIIIILAGITFVSVAQYQKNLRLMEMDGTAKEIFIAAQNHLSVAKASGDLDRLAENAKTSGSTSPIGTKLDPAPAYAGNTSGEYYSVIHNVTSGTESYTPTGGKQILEMMLPFGALDETVSVSGNYAIVYELKSASVVAVLYSGAGNASFGNAAVINFDAEDVNAIPSLYNDKSARKNYKKDDVTAIVGCYTGTAGSAVIPTATLEAPKLEVKNENKLHVLVREAKNTDNITLVITGEQSGTTARRLLNRDSSDGYENEKFDVTLDDITGDGKYRFSQLIKEKRFTADVAGSDFIPGENIIISAIASSTTALATPKESAKYTVSSLFDDVNETTNSTGDTKIYIKNLRHLENLGANVSGFTAALGKDTTSGHNNVVNITAVQKNDITMLLSAGLNGVDASGNITIFGSGTFSGRYIAANVNYALSYDGGSHEIYGLSIAPYSGGSGTEPNAGIFGNVTSTLSVKNLILRNDKIPENASATNAGMLLGKTSADLTVNGVLAYYHEDEYNSDNDSAVEVQASQVAGGLIGLVAGGKLDVKNSAAAVYVKVKGGSAAGGFIGSVSGAAEGSTIVQSYAGGHTRDGAYSTTDATNQPVLKGAGRYNVQATQASGYAGGFIGVTTNKVTMNAVYSTASAYASSGDANSNSFAGNGVPNISTDADGKKNYYAIGPHNGTDASADDTAKTQLAAGQTRRQATAYDRTLMGATETTAHPAMDKTSYPLNTIRHLCDSSVEDQDLPWFIKEHVGDWVVSKKTEEADFEVENGNRLTVRINTGLSTSTDTMKYGIKVHGETSHKDVYFLVSISDTISSVKRTHYYDGGPNTVDFLFCQRVNNDGNLGLEFYLDDITQPQGHFYNTCPWLTPGEDISISVVPETNGNLSGNAVDWRSIDFSAAETQKTNSLFGYLKESDEEDKHNKQKIEAVKPYNEEAGSVGMGLVTDGKGKYYVQIDNSRHLENLSPEVSSYPWKGTQSGISIAGGIQTDNIFWSGSSNGNAYTAGFQEELGTDLSVYGENNKLTQDGYFRSIVIDNTALSSYDGSGYEIIGLVAHKTTEKTSLALFLQTKHEMTIKNLTMENIDFSITGNESRAAGLIGYADKSVTIDNVYYTGQIKIRGTNCSGGFVGETAEQGKLTITNSGTKGSETITTIISDNKAGGLVGYAKINTTVKNVHFTGKLHVQGSECTGGFIGQTDKIVDVSNSGIECDATIESESGEAGGLIGYINGNDATVVNVKVTGKNTEIIATKNAGGLIGNISCPKLTISNVGVSAFIKSNSKEDQAGAGGLIGRIGNIGVGSTIDKSYYGGRTIEGNYDRCTVNEGTENVRSYDANINGEKSTGGLIGYLGTANNLSIDKCFSTGSVHAESEAAGGFIGTSLGWSQGYISIKNCYSMGKVSCTSSSKGGFIGKANGTSTFENVFYYSAFNTFNNPVGNNPGFSDIQVINDPDNIRAEDDSKTVNTHIYDTPTPEGKEYPYKNWTTEHDDTSTTMVTTYYGDWPKVPERRLKGYIAYYEVYGKDSIGVYVPGVDTKSPLVPKPTMDLNGQKTGYGILINTKDKKIAENYFVTSSGTKLAPLTNNMPEYESEHEFDYSVTLPDGDTYYLWRLTGNYESALIPANIAYGQAIPAAVRVYHLEDGKRMDEVEVNARYGAAIAPAGKLGSSAYPFRIRNDRHSSNYYSTGSKQNDENNQQYSDLYFVDDQKGTQPFKNKVS